MINWPFLSATTYNMYLIMSVILSRSIKAELRAPWALVIYGVIIIQWTQEDSYVYQMFVFCFTIVYLLIPKA